MRNMRLLLVSNALSHSFLFQLLLIPPSGICKTWFFREVIVLRVCRDEKLIFIKIFLIWLLSWDIQYDFPLSRVLSISRELTNNRSNQVIAF